MPEKISQSTVCIPAEYSEEPITNYTVLEMPPKGFSLALF
jgi:hypothetical protein